MKSMWIKKLRGYVKIAVSGEQLESFINKLYTSKIQIWDIKKTDNGMELYIHLSDFFRLRPLLKKTGCRMRVLRRHGFPFILRRLERRKIFLAGFIGFMICIYILSSLVWQVEIEGHEKLSEQLIIDTANELGIRKFQWKFKLASPEQLARQLQAALPDTSWVGVKVVGTTIQIKVVESAIPETKQLTNPRHLVAEADAVITEIIAEKGRPEVAVNTSVRKGDILISGIIGDEENKEIVTAEGIVKGLVWHEYAITVPLQQQLKRYTGEVQTKNYILIGHHALKVWGFGGNEFAQFETSVDRKQWHWRDWTIPFGWIEETVREAQYEVRSMTEQEAQQTGIHLAKAELSAKYGTDVKVKDMKMLDIKSDDHELNIHVLFEVEREITKEQPILPYETEEKDPKKSDA